MLKSSALAFYKNLSAIAEALGITHQAVSQWGPVVPEGTAYKLESLTRGKLKVDPALYLKGSARAQALAEAARP